MQCRWGRAAGERRVVLLVEATGERLLPIWVGQYEGDAIAITLVQAGGAEATHLRICRAPPRGRRRDVQQVRINRLAEETFYAEVVLDSTIGTTHDARPSDANCPGTGDGRPIRGAAEVMEQAGRNTEELSQSRPAESRSARERADQIREVVMPKARGDEHNGL